MHSRSRSGSTTALNAGGTARRRRAGSTSGPFILPPSGPSSPPLSPDLGLPPPYMEQDPHDPPSRTRTPSPITHRSRAPSITGLHPRPGSSPSITPLNRSRAPSRSQSSTTLSAMSSSYSMLSMSNFIARPAHSDTEDTDDDALYIRRRPPIPHFTGPQSPTTDTETESDAGILHRPVSTAAPMTETDDDHPPMALPTNRRRKPAFPYSFIANTGEPTPTNSPNPKLRKRYKSKDPMLILQDIEHALGRYYRFLVRLLITLSQPSALLFGPAHSRTALDVLFGLCRLLSTLPATCGIVHVLLFLSPSPSYTSLILHPKAGVCASPLHPFDILASILFILLTAYQCLCLTSGLLFRWRTYYPPLAALIRVLALQALCWAATYWTLTVLDVSARPHVVWALVATCTSVSRSVQMWATSNLWRQETEEPSGKDRWRGGRWKGRRWEWGAVTRRCIVPLGFGYFVMAWAGVGARVWC
ncbi:hypothetical protein CYLTODRAFT_487517 [Cylindrobasidium torrendii FP15055 ss-10]|uniref:N-glycosylation protein EOS1 n=1 Tax=Cylindrobasidium torrendii FP15055 ss-10 TaxID=1314674 RepID=A0A0D7BLR1_9AGAR|nr:hypothetical protein CYLTODRAFT_487517 [Cylindrobasidium torrendii FP15055 ss-10]